MKRKYTIILLCCLAALTSCSKLPLQKAYDYDPQPLDPHQHVSCWEYMGNNENLSLMKEAVERCGFEDYYSQTEKEYTFLLLDNKAFNEYVLPQLEAGSIAEANFSALGNIILYHIIKGNYNAYNHSLNYDPQFVLTLWNNLDAVMTIKLFNADETLSQKQQDKVMFMDQCGSSTIVSATRSNLLFNTGCGHIISRNCLYKK